MQGRDDILLKYAVPTFYDIYKSGGITLKDENRGLGLMLQYFPGQFTAEQLKENTRRYSVENVLGLVKDYFAKEFGYTAEKVELNNRYQRTVNSYIYNNKKDPAVVHIDELLESTLMAFFLSMFKWSKDFEKAETYGNCYRYLLYLMNDVCILGEMQGEDAVRVMLGMIAGDLQILQLAEDCYWTALTFTMAHEVAHAYLAAISREYDGHHLKKEEFAADEIAYHVVLKMIMDGESRGIVLEPYTYLAPMMYMDFFDLIYYTDRVLYKTYFYDNTHPTLKKRKGWLFRIVDREEYYLDTEEGNQLYRGFNMVYKEFRIQTLLKMERGKLVSILRTEQREQLRQRMKEAEDEQTAGNEV